MKNYFELEEMNLSTDPLLWVADSHFFRYNTTNIHDMTHRRGLTAQYFFSCTTSSDNSC